MKSQEKCMIKLLQMEIKKKDCYTYVKPQIV